MVKAISGRRASIHVGSFTPDALHGSAATRGPYGAIAASGVNEPQVVAVSWPPTAIVQSAPTVLIKQV